MRAESAPACRRIRQLLEHGAPWEACDAFNEALPGTEAAGGELLYCGALAHARAGATSRAHVLLEQAEAAAAGRPELLVEVLSLRGRLWKDGLHRTRDAAVRAAFAGRARANYAAAYALRHDTFPGVNAASLAMLAGETEAAAGLAHQIVMRLEALPAELDCWQLATLGEAQVLLGRLDAARQSYAAAVDRAPGEAGTVATMRRQLRLLADVVPGAAALFDVLPTASVLAFAGHMVDAPDRAGAPRFPARIEPALGAEIRARLAALHQPVVYTSAACGADLLCIEAALELGAEVNIVLPFDRDDFIATSVAVGGSAWLPRFERALAGAARVIFATEEAYLGDDALFDHAACLVEGLALLRAGQLETTAQFLAVVDPDAEGTVGGTLSSVARWRRSHAHIQTIDLRLLTAEASGGKTDEETVAQSTTSKGPVAARSGSVSGAAEPEPRATAALSAAKISQPRRTLKTMLFADFSGFGRLHDAFAPLFHTRFLALVAEQIDACQPRPLQANTWGDALYVVFADAYAGAGFALSLLERMLAVDWTAAGLSDTSQIRIALHAGPVFCGFDPIVGRNNFFGSSVTRTARIEPVTPPGTVYASEAFAATLASSGDDDHTTEYMGRLALAKGYGESPIYRLLRR